MYIRNNLFVGEHIKNWRSRYFVLRDDGTLVGFKAKPDQQIATSAQPLNNFTVRGCQIMSVDRPKPYTFVIRGLQWTTVIERTFHVETEQEREDWVAAIRFVFINIIFKLLRHLSRFSLVSVFHRYVANRLANEEQQQEQPQMQQSSSSEDVDMEPSIGARSDSCTSLGVVTTDIDGGSIDELSAKFSVQGTSSSKSTGKKKVVSYIALISVSDYNSQKTYCCI